GSEVIAATPVTLADVSVLSHSVRNAGGPAAMKSTEPARRASFITEGPPSSIQVTFTSVPASLACFSTRLNFSITSKGRKPTPPAPGGMRIVSPPLCGAREQLAPKSSRQSAKRPSMDLACGGVHWNCSPHQIADVFQVVDLPAHLDRLLHLIW